MTPGEALIISLKATATAGKRSLALPVGTPVAALLRAIPTAPGQLDNEDVRCLSEWRNRFVKSFLTEFDANATRTANWLSTAVHNDKGKILLMLEDLSGTRIGHIGLGFIDWKTGYGEADAIVRGGDAPPGLMKEALKTVLSWAKEQLGLTHLAVRVRSDNTAMEFYRKCGFVETKRVPLAVKRNPDMTTWYEDTSVGPEPSLVYMDYRP